VPRAGLDEPNLTCKVETGRGLAKAGCTSHGRHGLRLCSGDMMLEALVACARVAARGGHAARHEVAGEIRAEGDVDLRGCLGMDEAVPVGFTSIRLRFDLESDEPQEKLDELLRLTSSTAWSNNTLRNPTPVEFDLARS